jgi:cyclase
MLRTRVIPCLLLSDGSLVKTVRFKHPAYVGDPVNAVRIFNEKEVDEIVVLDIAASRAGQEPAFDTIAEIAGECFMPLTYGGGVASVEHMRRLFSMGVEKVAINTHGIENPRLVGQASSVFGSQSIIAALDIKKGVLGKYTAYTQGGQRSTGMEAAELARRMEAEGAGEILLNSIDRDGTWSGYDVELIRRVSEAVSIPVVACGGAGSVADFREAVRDGGASAVAAGSMVVYQARGHGVLVNFPVRAELEIALGERAGWKETDERAV